VADYIWGTGRRKESVARARIKPGKGLIKVNDRDLEEYLNGREIYIHRVMLPLKTSENLNKYDVYLNVFGGGLTGQAGAICMAIARALVKADERNKPVLKRNGLLTRDSRMVERKKPGLRKARRSKQFSKR